MRQSPSPAYRARKRRKPNDVTQKGRTPSPIVPKSVQKPAYGLAALLWPARSTASRWAAVPLILIFAGLFRWATGLWGYSGFNTPPLYGDFEAQRHWMEVTTGLPISQWYFHDLKWWGLDYPPLTAYHSWVCGRIGSLFDRSWFALRTSRGLESQLLKVYMRATVIVSEFLTFIPAVVVFVRNFSQRSHISTWHASVALAAILFQPGIVLVDHGHFQYNTVMLGFVVATMACMVTDHLLWSCVFFVAALGFKQMALYYAPVVFAYLLGSCVIPRFNILRLAAIGVVTLSSFVVLYSPLMLGPLYDRHRGISMAELEEPPLMRSLAIQDKTSYYPVLLQLAQSIHRIFPFQRGLFEDKVANFWCTLHTFHKLHQYPQQLLQRVSLGATLASVLPPSLLLGISPKWRQLPAAFATSAWGFFLFSFQVHEKTVLLPLLPMTLALAGPRGLDAENRAWIAWANTLGCWTIFPLLKREELGMPYAVLMLLWTWLMGQPSVFFSADRPSLFTQVLHSSFYLAMIVWHTADHFVTPPDGKPDLWLVANVLLGFVGFSICYAWCLWQLLQDTLEQRGWLQSDAPKNSKAASRKAQ